MRTERQAREAEAFDRLVEETGDVWWGHATPAGQVRLALRARLLARALPPGARQRCLELGCGTGAFTEHVLALGRDLTWEGVDVSPRCVEVARARLGRPGVSFRVAPAEALGVDDGSLDLVCGNSVLHHLDWPAALREALRALRPGGRLWFSEPNLLNPQIALQCHVRPVGRRLEVTDDETAFVRWSLARDVRAAGFVDVRVRPFDWLHPSLPRPLIPLGRLTSALLERAPLVREVSGSLEVTATRP